MEHATKRTTSAPKLVLEPVRQSPRIDSRPMSVGRYLIGSASDCDITISVAGVAPQHCLMIVGANKTIVKAISPLTWINDGPLTEAVLKHGERLILGPVELRTRLPEVSEWVSQGEDDGVKSKSPAPPSADVVSQYEPPQIEELLDQARQHLQAAIDGPIDHENSWSEDLPLAEAVQIHAASTAGNSQSDDLVAKSHEQTIEIEKLRAVLDGRALELDERSRAVDYLSTELSAREEQLMTRERELIGRESRLQSIVDEVDHREEALIAEERALHTRIRQATEAEQQSAQTVAEQLEERTRILEEEQARVEQLFAVIEQQLPELQRQSTELSAQKQALDARDAELTALEASLNQQSQEIRALAEMPAPVVDTTSLELREAALARREAVLTASMATLQTSREQIAEESSQLEQRFADLVEREQAWQRRSAELGETAQRTETEAQSLAARLMDVGQREADTLTASAGLVERETNLLKTKVDVEAREQVLIALRSELDSREESLNQQFVQLQKDRSGLRASQLKLQMTEQAGKNQIGEIELQLQQRTSELSAATSRLSQLEESHAQQLGLMQAEAHKTEQLLQAAQTEVQSLQQRFAELELNLQVTTEQLAQSEAELGDQRTRLHEALNCLEAMKTENALVASQPAAASEVQPSTSPELEQRWAELAQAQAEYAQDQQELTRWREELEALQAQLESDLTAQEAALAERAQHSPVADPGSLVADDAPSEANLQALLAERQALSTLREEVEQEYKALRAEREEALQARLRFEQERVELDVIKSEASAERDGFLIERHSVISMRQTFDEREREIRQRDAASGQLKAEAEKTIAGLELQQRRLDEQRVHLEEEWEALREEREVQRQAEAELDSQRQELANFAQQLEQYRSSGEIETLPVNDGDTDDQFDEYSAASTEVITEIEPSDRIEEASDTADSEELGADEYEEEVIDPLAGFASFSSIGGRSSDEMLPPEIAEIIRRVGGQAAANYSPESNYRSSAADSSGPVVASEQAPLAPAFAHAQEAPLHEVEERRLKDLLGHSSESYVDAASAHSDVESHDYSSTSEADAEPSDASWEAVSEDDVYEHTSDMIAESVNIEEVGLEDNKSSELRSRLSEMFGINLGPSGGALPESGDDQRVADASVESAWEEATGASEAEYDQEEMYLDDAEAVADDSELEGADETVAEESISDDENVPIDESLDPVAAYMEQLLARTRKASAKSAPPAPKPVPPPIAPVAPPAPVVPADGAQEPDSDLSDEIATKTVKSVRKHEQVDKNALRANLDSFRTIANSQARSNVARSESKRLIIMSQAKQIFLVSSALITVILISTEFWTERKYRLEMLAGVIATTFLGFDYYRTQRRLRQLGLLSGVEPDSVEESKGQGEESL